MDVDFKTVRRDVADYSWTESLRRFACTTALTVRTSCTDTHVAVASSKRRSSTDGTLGEGMRDAIKHIRHGYGAMIEAWRKH
jgi:hypothetical protein